MRPHPTAAGLKKEDTVINWTKFSYAGIGVFLVALLTASVLGCGPEPQPQPTTPVQTVQTTPQPAYRPTTEEWVRMPVRILYPTGGSRLDDQGRAMIREGHASMAHRTDIIRIKVIGYTDRRGNAEQNRRLSLERAQGVVDFMVGDLGMPRELFETEHRGEDAPITSGTTEQDRIQNRRVEFEILVRRTAAY